MFLKTHLQILKMVQHVWNKLSRSKTVSTLIRNTLRVKGEKLRNRAITPIQELGCKSKLRKLDFYLATLLHFHLVFDSVFRQQTWRITRLLAGGTLYNNKTAYNNILVIGSMSQKRNVACGPLPRKVSNLIH